MNPIAGLGDNPIVAVILLCEIGFWVTVGLGLLLRYVLRLGTLSSIVLALVPLIDVILVVAVALDVHRGAEVTGVHRIAGIYLGWTVVFGKSTVRWLDSWFAYRFAGGPRPQKRPKEGPEAYRAEMRSFIKWLVAAGIALVVCFGLSVTVADPAQATALRGVLQPLGVITIVWFLTGPAWVKGKKEVSR
ncbi:hypothetical protein NDR87_10855 [Nocardia sp. CDC159]|uniref:Membrane protein YmcC n=1 Tax=Nocardia pulmonis TaxID=2951408 RepID=A0A9X2E6Z3_9NOCA|nr:MULTISPECIES: hypothetical protein [Nocardia]MCM6773970.1 hypothetical protein [Nocardia pulmonis]MCM6786857.1 hypothetical protein [Nocardia sp. CDC159]